MQINPDVVFRVLGENAVIVDLSTNRVFELNPTGVAIWEGIGRGESLDTICAGLAASFDVDEATARSETSDLVARLRTAGLLTP